jgi:hypothetical protein
MRTACVAGSLFFLHSAMRGQTTQGLITGRVVSSRSARPVPGAKVKYESRAGSIGGEAKTGTTGYFNLPMLSPGFYRLHVEAAGFQPQELEQVELAVAGWLDFNFRLRPLNDVWEAGQYRSILFPDSDAAVMFFGPDVDISRSGSFDATRGVETEMDASLSTVIDQQLIANLPLNGRDVYALLATLPGVTADTTTARGLGLAIDGQRPSVSNFLLDGLENNNYLITGPLTQLPPEDIEEYRISATNYSAEFGRTSGFVANAITRAPGRRWHGLVYDYQRAAELDANGFQENANGVARLPLRGIEPGFFLGGPILRNRLFVSAALDVSRFRTKQDPETISLPTSSLVRSATGAARQLLQQYAPPPVANGTSSTAELTVEPPIATNQMLVSPRVDYLTHNDASRFLFRSSILLEDQPDFAWTPYSAFVTPLMSDSSNLEGAWLWNGSPSLSSEARVGLTTDEAHFNRPHPDVPTLTSADFTVLPGSPLPYSYRNHGRNIEVVDTFSRTSGRHTIKFGAGLLTRTITGYVAAFQDGYFGFASALAFAQNQPVGFYIARMRQQPDLNVTPSYSRAYRQTEVFGFVQDSIRLTPRFAVSIGVRYENFGSPTNTGGLKDALLQLGDGSSLEQRIAGAQMAYPGPGNEKIYDGDNRGIAPRAGFSYSLRRDSNTVMRGGFGIFYDRPFDNLWETLQINNLVLEASQSQPPPFLLPVTQAAAAVPLQPIINFPTLTLFQPGLRNAYSENGFWGIEQRAAEHLVLQANLVGSFGRELLTTDLVNRALSVPPVPFKNPDGISNPQFPMVAYRANQGLSDYYGVQAVARYRSSRLQLQASYTWSHAIDNQSEPLAGEFFDFSFPTGNPTPVAAFTRQFDSNADRANADFDQRDNVVAYAVWEIPAAFAAAKAARVFRDWTLGGLTAIRSGFPFSPLSETASFNGSGQDYVNNRPNLVNPAQAVIDTPAPGGVQILNPTAFAAPAPGQLGNLGRNAFRGPGLYSADFSLSRRFRLARLGESGRLTLRADAFNLLNHANLNNPVLILGTPAPNPFGSALYGRQGFDPGFPTSVPLNEAPRQIQIMVRLEF